MGLSAFRPASIEVIPIVGIIFGFIGISAAMRQMISFVYKPKEKMFWWYGHLAELIASYIAAWSAFSVVTLGQMLGNTWYLWLWPSMVGFRRLRLRRPITRGSYTEGEGGCVGDAVGMFQECALWNWVTAFCAA